MVYQNKGRIFEGDNAFWKKAVTAIAAFLISSFITFGGKADVNEFGFWIFQNVGRDGILASTAIVFGVYYLLNKYAKRLMAERIGIAETMIHMLFSAFFTLFSMLSKYFIIGTDWGLGVMLGNLSAKISAVLAFAGGMVLFMLVFRGIWSLSGSGIRENKLTENKGFLYSFFGKHQFRNCMLLLFLVWLPQYIIRFPGTMAYDAWRSIGIYFGELERTTQHPLIWVSVIGKLTEIGMRIGINWLAPLVICIVQHILLILLVAYTVYALKEFGVSVRVMAIVLLFYAFLPPMFMFASTVYNDTLYSAAIQLLTVELLYLLYDRENYFKVKRHWILTVIAVLATILRYNGFYLMLAVIAAVAAYELYLLIKKHTRMLQTSFVLCLLIIPLMAGQGIQKGFNALYEARSIASRAMMAMPIQQTARCLMIYGNDIPKEDYEAIHAVMTWTDEEYARAYNPVRFDEVKNSFKKDATREEINAFLKAWLNLVIRYPDTCFMATANVNYSLFSPLVQNVRYYGLIYDQVNTVYDELGYDASDVFKYDESKQAPTKVDFRMTMQSIFPAIPVLGLIENQGIYTILLAGICACTLFKKDRRVLVLAMALLVTLGITAIGPAVKGHARYTYPIMYSMPVLLTAFMYSNLRRNTKMNKEEN